MEICKEKCMIATRPRGDIDPTLAKEQRTTQRGPNQRAHMHGS